MTAPGGVGSAGVVLLVVLVIGVLAGRAKRRWTLLLVGLVVIAVVGAIVAATRGTPAQRPQELAQLLSTAVPPAVAFVAGWLCARGTWFRRIVVIAVAALLLAVFPYAAAGGALARLFPA